MTTYRLSSDSGSIVLAVNDRIKIQNVVVVINKIKGDSVEIGIDAPKHVKILRSELIQKPPINNLET